MQVLSAPFTFAFKWTVPKCDDPEYEKFYIVTFCMCCAWIGVLSFAMAYFATAIGCLIHMDPGAHP